MPSELMGFEDEHYTKLGQTNINVISASVFRTAPPTGHVYLIKHVKIINVRTSVNHVQVFRGITAATRLMFDQRMLVGAWGEFTGMWVVNGGDDVVAQSGADNSATIVLYGLDLTP